MEKSTVCDILPGKCEYKIQCEGKICFGYLAYRYDIAQLV